MKEFNIWGLFCDVISTVFNKMVVFFWASLSFIFLITGKKDSMIECLLVFMMLDYISGIFKSLILKKLNSKIGFRGILKKILILIIVVMSYRLDIILHLTKIDYNVRFCIIIFYIANEGLSILENVALAGLPVPTQLKELLEQYKEQKIQSK